MDRQWINLAGHRNRSFVKHLTMSNKITVCEYDKLSLGEMSVRYMQPANSCNADGDLESLKIKIMDGGAGHFFVLKSKGWSFDSVDDLINILNDFKSRLEK
jgi:hypothetical protein